MYSVKKGHFLGWFENKDTGFLSFCQSFFNSWRKYCAKGSELHCRNAMIKAWVDVQLCWTWKWSVVHVSCLYWNGHAASEVLHFIDKPHVLSCGVEKALHCGTEASMKYNWLKAYHKNIFQAQYHMTSLFHASTHEITHLFHAGMHTVY